MNAALHRAVRAFTRFVGPRLPGALKHETISGRAYRSLGPDCFITRLIDRRLGPGHCREQFLHEVFLRMKDE